LLLQREAVLASASYRSGKLEEGLAEAFLAVEQRMQDQSARRELYCLREGARAGELLVLELLLAAMCGTSASGQEVVGEPAAWVLWRQTPAWVRHGCKCNPWQAGHMVCTGKVGGPRHNTRLMFWQNLHAYNRHTQWQVNLQRCSRSH
jgi:hypothetical protein